ncbi:uncharacterized protein wu:fe05a04 [Esox lucius]|uniref:C2H2-type domain-containing protein n=1 Tax=Esox lucius TaxID=8010 RepID=A0A3P8Z0B3_ESOLU|nr:uncharacterized protein wu:fe05a04 [Esox lucius]XP_010892455.2 uncharacterized protein wu:fe05a04 [Esox lucius]
MSDFTIDIQLTELGFPDILQPRESTCVKETPLPSAAVNTCISSAPLTNRQTLSSSPAATPAVLDTGLVSVVDQQVSVASETACPTQLVISQSDPHVTVTPSPSGPSQTLTGLSPPHPSTDQHVAVAHTSPPGTPMLPKSESKGLLQNPKITKKVLISVSRVGTGTVFTTVTPSSTNVQPLTSLFAPVISSPVEQLATIKNDSKLSLGDKTDKIQITKPVDTIKVVSYEAEEKEKGGAESKGGRIGIEEKGVCADDADNGKAPRTKEEKEIVNTVLEDSDETDDSEVSENEDDEEEEEDDDDDDEELGPEASGGSGEHHCSVCDLVLFSSFQLQEHMNLHTGARPYCCAECGKRFCQLANYRSHLRTHAQPQTAVPAVEHRCRICLKGFDSQEGLQEHLTKSHFEKEFYECDICKRIFTCRTKCEEHMEEHKRKLAGNVCRQCDRRFRLRRSLRRHEERGCVRSYRCTDCPLSFSRKNTLLRHSFSHLGLLPYTCVQCRRHFRLARLYRKHVCDPERIHCVACLGVFHSRSDFQRHKKETGCWGQQGTRGDEIRCMECGQAFSTAEELKRHAGAHQRVMTCSECGKGFRSALMLMSHMGGHAGSRPCLCKNCGLGFPHQQGYESHLKDCGLKLHPVMAQKKPRKEVPAAPSSIPQLTPRRLPIPPLVKKSERNVSVPFPTPVRMPGSVLTGAPMAVPAPTPVRISAVAPLSAPIEVPVEVSNPTAVRVVSPVEPTKGVWKLSLDKQPPPGVSLVMFVPANTPLASGLSGPSSPFPQLQGTQPLWKILNPAPNPGPPLVLGQSSLTSEPVLSPIARENQSYSSNSPLDLVIKTGGYKQEPANILPLDLSKKLTPASLSVKAEPIDPGFSEENRDVFTGYRVDSKDKVFQSKKGEVCKMETMAQKGGNREESGDKARQNDCIDKETVQAKTLKASRPGVPSALQIQNDVTQTKSQKDTAVMDSVNRLKVEAVSSLHSELSLGLVQIKQEPVSPDAYSGTQSSDLFLTGALKRETEPDVGLDLRWDGGTPGLVLDLRLNVGHTASVSVAEKAEESDMAVDMAVGRDSAEVAVQGGVQESSANNYGLQEKEVVDNGKEEEKEEEEEGKSEERIAQVNLCLTRGNVLPLGEDVAQNCRLHAEESDGSVVEPGRNPETQLPSPIRSAPSSPPCKRRRSLRSREKPKALNNCLL